MFISKNISDSQPLINSHNILLVESNLSKRLKTALQLEKKGHHVSMTDSLKKAEVIQKQKKIDSILTGELSLADYLTAIKFRETATWGYPSAI